MTLLLAFFLQFAFAEFKVPPLTGPVVDEIGLLSTSTKQGLEKAIRTAREAGRVQLQVAILNSLQGLTVESASIQIVDQWKLGSEKGDNGILFLVVPFERKMRIEVGQGLEGDIPDVIANRILADRVRPYFRENRMEAGVIAGVEGILQAVSHGQVDQPPAKSSKGGMSKGYIAFIIFILLLRLLIGFSGGSGRRRLLGGRGSGWGGGGFGGFGGGSGGGWSGGGGGFSGGGASGSW